MADRPGTFSLQLQRFIEKAGDNVDQVVRKSALQVAQSVIMKSPVGDPTKWKSKPPPGYVGGRLRANWNVAFGRIDPLTTPSTDKSGAKTTDRIRIQLNGWTVESGDIYITNSLPYAIPVEYGHSKSQAPAGMVRITVAEWNGFVAQAANEVPK